MHIHHIRRLVYLLFFYHVIFATWCNWLDFYWCWIKFCLSLSLNPQLMPMWPLDISSGIPSTTQGFGDATMWHPCVPQYRPGQTTEQWVQEFQMGYWLAWLPLCFQIAISPQRQHTAEVFDTNPTHTFGSTRQIRTPQERIDWDRTESAGGCEIV